MVVVSPVRSLVVGNWRAVANPPVDPGQGGNDGGGMRAIQAPLHKPISLNCCATGGEFSTIYYVQGNDFSY